jgi:hypothetical protein
MINIIMFMIAMIFIFIYLVVISQIIGVDF